jgi:hypothetical protein
MSVLFQFPVICKVIILYVLLCLSACIRLLILYTELTDWLFPMLLIGGKSCLCKRMSQHTSCNHGVWFHLSKCINSKDNNFALLIHEVSLLDVEVGVCCATGIIGLFLGTFTELQKATLSFVVSVCVSAWINSAPIGWILMKFDILVFQISVYKLQVLLKCDK